MKKISVFIIVIFSILAAGFAFAGQPAAKALEFVKFNSAHDNRYSVVFGETGNVAGIFATAPGLYSRRGSKAPDAVQIAFDFLKNNSGIFDISNVSDLGAEKVDRSTNVTHVLFAHYINAKKVLGSTISVHVNDAGDVVMVNNGLSRICASPVINDSISSEKAVEIAKRHINCAATRSGVKTTAVKYCKNGAALDAVKVDIPSQDPLGDFVCIVNEADRTVIESTDIMNHAGEIAAAGSVYVSNPLKCGITNEPLLYLKPNAKWGMEGKWALIFNEDTKPVSFAADGKYCFDPNDTHFDEINVYYYINTMHDYYSKLGFTGLDRQIRVTVHYSRNYDNAFFSPMEDLIALGDGDRLNDLAKEESVTFHEYTHAATYAIVPMSYSAESGAICEAFSDYFACTASNDPYLGEWTMAKINKPYIRTMENQTHYPEDIHNEVHYDSCIYSGGLWDLRKAIGVEAADRIIHFSRYYLKGIKNQKFTDGVNALLAADREHFAGANAETIKSLFAGRGIKPQTGPSTLAELRDALRFGALNGDKDAAQMLADIENGNIK